jgi:hypothetical protein
LAEEKTINWSWPVDVSELEASEVDAATKAMLRPSPM